MSESRERDEKGVAGRTEEKSVRSVGIRSGRDELFGGRDVAFPVAESRLVEAARARDRETGGEGEEKEKKKDPRSEAGGGFSASSAPTMELSADLVECKVQSSEF